MTVYIHKLLHYLLFYLFFAVLDVRVYHVVHTLSFKLLSFFYIYYYKCMELKWRYHITDDAGTLHKI